MKQKGIRKYHVINQMKEANELHRKRGGSERSVYLVATLKKRYEPSCECMMWSVGRNLYFDVLILGETLKDVYEYLEEILQWDRMAALH
jgi:hypothetical protein